MNKTCLKVCLALLWCAAMASAQDARISVDAGHTENTVSRWLSGSCIEDVNHEIYGGLYNQKIFGESFEEPPPNPRLVSWNSFGGEWKADGTGIEVGAAAGAKLVNAAPSFSDGTLETELRFPDANGDNAGLLVRVSDAGVGADVFNGYEISLEPTTKQLILGKHRHNWQPLQSVAAPFSPREWNRLRVELTGARIRVFLNGAAAPLIDFTDSQAPLLSGTFGLRTWNSHASFRDVRAGNRMQGFDSTPATPVSGQWDAVQSGIARAEFLRDQVNPFNGACCQMVEHGQGTGVVGVANRGLNRWGIAVKRGKPLGGRLYLRAHDLRGPVTLSLQSADGKRTYAAQKIATVGADWARFPISFIPSADDTAARFAVTIDRPGTLWVDQATLSGTGTEQFKSLPVRADIGRAMQAQGLTFLRYGGTMVNVPGYRWKQMIGDPDKRPPYRGNWYPFSSNAFGIEDFLRFCEAAGFEAAFALNVEESEQDAADLVDYLNGDATTLWGRRRIQNGHPAPYDVHWIELGNEEVIGSDDVAGYDHYSARFNALYGAMHARDARIQFVCSAWWRPESSNMERVFKALDGKAAFWDLHVWSDDARSGATVDRDLTRMQSLFRSWNPASSMKCVIFEENGGLHSQQRALGHASTLNAVRRHGDFVMVSCAANALQPNGQNDNGWDQGQIFFSPAEVWGMPPFYATQMAAQNYQPLRVQSIVAGDLDVTATQSQDGNTLVLHVVNAGATTQTAAVALSGFEGVSPQAQVWTLAGDPGAINSPTSIRAKSQPSTFSGVSTRFSFPFAAHSYTVMRLTKPNK